jgi:hypothetical protein
LGAATPAVAAEALIAQPEAVADSHLTRLWFLLNTILGADRSAATRSEQELCTVWRHVFLTFGSKSDRLVDPSNVSKYDWNIRMDSPVRSFFIAAGSQDPRDGAFRVSQVLPLLPEACRGGYFVALAISFAAMVMRPASCTQGLYSPFLSNLAIILRGSDHQRHINSHLDATVEMRPQLSAIIRDMERHITIVLACRNEFGTHRSRRDALSRWHVRLFRHMAERGDSELLALWFNHSLRHFALLDSHWNGGQAIPDDSYERPFPRNVCRALITLASLSRVPHLARKTWDELVDRGFKPDMEDWQKLIGSAKRVDAAADVWKALCDSGAEPDSAAWTSRIYAVAELGNADLAMTILKDMTERWINAATTLHPEEQFRDIPDLPTAPKPTIRTINVILKSLTGRKDRRAVQNVLNMAWSLGLKPDMYTLNIVLAMYCRAGNISSALDTIRHFTMADPSLEPDLISLTTLIDGVNHFQTSTPKMMNNFADRLNRVLELIAGRGLKLDDVFFSALLRAVATKTDFGVAVEVLRHAHRHLGLGACVHTSTEFLRHAFRAARENPKSEPDVVQLVLRLAIQIDRRGDAVFWNHLVYHFAHLGRVEYLPQFLATLRANGQLPGWTALFAALSAALKRRDLPLIEVVLTESQRAADARGSTVGLDPREVAAREDFLLLFGDIEGFLAEGDDVDERQLLLAAPDNLIDC